MSAEPTDAGSGRGSLAGHVSAIEPPPDLAGRVRETLVSRGLLATRRNRPVAWATRAGLLAAGIVIGVLARDTLGGTGGRPANASAGQYVLLLYGDPPGDTGAVHVTREREYGQWAAGLRNGTRWVGGQELGDVIETLGPPQTAASPSSDRLAGYFVIDAPSRERAAEVARSCPHLKYGGRVVLMTVAS
jgi:hypothetical protein